MDEFTGSQERIIEDALGERPLATLPSGFINTVLSQIQSTPFQVSREAIRFKLEPLDVALPLLGTCLVVLALGLAGQFAFLGIATPVTWSAVIPAPLHRLPTEWFSANWLSLIGLLAFAEICLGAIVYAWMWQDRPPATGEA